MTQELTFYRSIARASMIRGRRVFRVRGWPRGKNSSGLVQDVISGKRFVTPLRALRKVACRYVEPDLGPGHKIKEASVMSIFDSKIWTGRDHATALGKMRDEGRSMTDCQCAEQGFVTDDDVMIYRMTAGRVALEAGQVSELRWPNVGLHSEEINGDLVGRDI